MCSSFFLTAAELVAPLTARRVDLVLLVQVLVLLDDGSSSSETCEARTSQYVEG